jgi:thiol-disulfide isomerase/thioredoxin
MDYNPDAPSWVAKHFGSWSAKRGSKFTKDYDRPVTVKSMLRFIKDPSAETTWEEDVASVDVKHATDRTFESILAGTQKTLVMFYAPWCGHCKTFKPHMASVATRLKEEGDEEWTFVGIDTNSPPGVKTGKKYDVKGYPKLMYFENGQMAHEYGGDRTAEGLYAWTKDPVEPPPPPPPEPEWKDSPSAAHVAFPAQSEFREYVKGQSSVMVMFMAPWCGYCKKAKPA